MRGELVAFAGLKAAMIEDDLPLGLGDFNADDLTAARHVRPLAFDAEWILSIVGGEHAALVDELEVPAIDVAEAVTSRQLRAVERNKLAEPGLWRKRLGAFVVARAIAVEVLGRAAGEAKSVLALKAKSG